MKKYTTLLVFGIVFSGFLAMQILFSFTGLHAVSATKEKGQNTLFEEIFQKIELHSTNAQKFKLSQTTAPIVILNFWASWCRPCMEELPSLVLLRNKYPQTKIVILGINSDEEDQSENILRVQKKFGLNFPMVADQSGAIANQFMISAIPVSIIYKNGKVVEISQGPKDFYSQEMLQKIETWIK
jgi:thiol-disulfide isomerase/thioredoxin